VTLGWIERPIPIHIFRIHVFSFHGIENAREGKRTSVHEV